MELVRVIPSPHCAAGWEPEALLVPLVGSASAMLPGVPRRWGDTIFYCITKNLLSLSTPQSSQGPQRVGCSGWLRLPPWLFKARCN